MVIIMISGYMQSGKDTVGNYLCQKHGYMRFAFADELKNEVAELYGMTPMLMNTSQGKNTLLSLCKPGSSVETMTVRQLLIKHGSFRRSEDINCFAKIVAEKILEEKKTDTFLERQTKIVITDWRLPNEIDVIKEYCKEENVYKLRIDKWDKPPSSDYTEIALDDFEFDKVIDNKNINLTTLYENIDKFILEEKI